MHKKICLLAWPIILSNISVPLLGLVDSAILGHLDSAVYLASVALGANILTFVFWSFGFLRMSTTGLVAQASGRNDQQQSIKLLYQGLLLALCIGFILIICRPFLIAASIYVMGASDQVSSIASDYLGIRLWAAPATLSLYVFIGWFIGQQNTRLPLTILVSTNLLNALLDYLMVFHFHLNAQGIAWATLIAEYTAVILAMYLLVKNYGYPKLPHARIFDDLPKLIHLNKFLFIRTLVLLLVFAFFTSQGARMGDNILAVNALLLTLLMFISNALDGFAHAAESLCGRYYAQQNQFKLNKAIAYTGIWSFAVALVFSLALFLQGENIILLITDQAELIHEFRMYLPFLILLPLIAVGGYWLDGIFIGLTLVKSMQNTMLISALLVFIPLWLLLQSLQNTGLWLALYGFMFCRGFSMGLILLRVIRQ